MFKKWTAKRKLKAEMPELLEFKERLDLFEKTADPVREIVNFFDYISIWQDCGGVEELIEFFRRAKDKQTLQVLKTLQKHIEECGRQPYGMNRTKKGQRVTQHNVYLGNVSGIWTFPVSEFITSKDKDNEKDPRTGLTVHETIEKQARDFMCFHADSMAKLITGLEELVA